ncbi:carboxypeptidase-like regulatory domain-containing protein, partial [Halobacterium salinarum]|nr:carboxypeptidase-like regulatory domain-containing protein [Halobacterium salinarum]
MFDSMDTIRPTIRRTAVVVTAVAVIAALAAAGSTAAAASSPPTPPHRFFGTVSDADGHPAGNVTVEVVHNGSVVASNTTADSGYYDLIVPADAVSAGRSVTVTARNQSAQFEWTAAGSTEVEFTLGPSGGSDVDDGTDSGGGTDGDTGGSGDEAGG